LSSVVK